MLAATCTCLQGVAGDVVVGELSALELIALEDDVLSLELGAAFKVGCVSSTWQGFTTPSVRTQVLLPQGHLH
jgi:hypothetical protein